jgi:hypothetical protein
VNIKSQKDFFSGLMFMGVGAAFAWGAGSYTVGSGARMGPGYFPLALGVLLTILGAIITFKALVVETVDGDKIGAWAWRPLFFIILANLVFGAAIGGLPSIGLPAIGLGFAIFILVAVASMAETEAPVAAIWLGGVIGLLMGAFIVSLCAPKLVSVISPASYFAEQEMTSTFFSVWWWVANTVGRLISFVLVAVVFWRWAPLSKQIKEYSVLTATLIALSVWAFIELIRIQIALWPAIFTS